MRALAGGIDDCLNDEGEKRNGFVLLIFPFGAEVGRRTNYVSNANRRDVIIAMKEIVARLEGQPYINGNA